MTKPKPETEASLSAVRVKRVSDLTPDEKRIIVAEFDGYTNIRPLVIQNVRFKGDDKTCGITSDTGWIPQYDTDQNAIIAACGKLCQSMAKESRFRNHLHDLGCREIIDKINATASQRTDALILTIGAATL